MRKREKERCLNMKTILKVLKNLLLSYFCSLLFVSAIAYANDKNVENVVPDKELCSTIVATDFYEAEWEVKTGR